MLYLLISLENNDNSEAEGDQVKWATQDELEDGFVQQVGELITEHNM